MIVAELPGKKTKNKLGVKVSWNCDHIDCRNYVQKYCAEYNFEVPTFRTEEFFVPYGLENSKCAVDSTETIVRSVYAKS